MFFAVIAPACVTAQKTAGAKNPKSRVFAPEMDRGFENAQPPSDLILDALLKTPEAENSTDGLKGLDREVLRKLFEVAPAELTDQVEEDYVALGNGLMSGTDNSWFWIVRVRNGKVDVLLFTNGLAVELLHHKTKGYRDIREGWAGNSGSVTRIYRYSGAMYELASEHSEGPPQ
jgi:hypothetical protein